MLVVDTSAFVSLGVTSVYGSVFAEFDVATTDCVLDELEQTAEYADRHGTAATAILDSRDSFDVFDRSGEAFTTSRIDDGEASCVALARAQEAPFLITDDYRALPELRPLVPGDVAVSPLILRALTDREVLTQSEAEAAFEHMASERDWLEAPIYRYARRVFE
ncbi:hypothetical protein GRX01_03995 [Halobaculum sp. WSA2]|uniref:PIN domain-containing protein n=1 Tax=Halobaculum saliterrae TaxID=2073113 RepID=A0A6B0SX22_9EURY|nr:PIN domain-containing protein [Halobaculum saliterrae]MXR40510.1 hypothetical protein [Halobaculum saliterrae]